MYITVNQDVDVEIDNDVIEDFIKQASKEDLNKLANMLAERCSIILPIESLYSKFTFNSLDDFLEEFQDFAKEQGYYFNFPTTGL